MTGSAAAAASFSVIFAITALLVVLTEFTVNSAIAALMMPVLAATAVGLQLNLAKLPLQASTLGGFTLTVDGQTVDSALRNWSLAGDARILGSIELTPEAGLPAPPAPHWSV